MNPAKATVSSNFNRQSIQIRANQQPKTQLGQVIRLKTNSVKNQDREQSSQSIQIKKTNPNKVPIKSIKSRNIINTLALQQAGLTLPLQLNSSNLIAKPNSSEGHESALHGQDLHLSVRMAAELIHNSHDNIKPQVVMKNNFVNESTSSEQHREETQFKQ